MSGGKGKKTSTQTQVSKPPGYLGRANEYGLDAARALYDKGPDQYYPNNMVQGFDPLQSEAANYTVEMARNGSPLIRSSQNLIQDTLDGKFIGGNPYIDDLLLSYGNKANSMVMSNFNKSGRMGSGANAATAGRAITDATLPVLFDQYNTERNNQYMAAQVAPELAEQDFINQNRIAAVGDARQAQGQRVIDADVNKWNFNQQADDMALDQYLQRVYGSPGWNFGTTTNTQTQSGGGGGLGSILGAAASIGSMFVPGMQGMGLAGLSGGLSGMLSSAGLANTMLGRGMGGFSGASTPLASGGAINWLR